MRVLVSGGAGYVGSHTTVKLIENGYDTVIADNFSNSSEKVIARLNKLCKMEIPTEKLDFCDLNETRKLFEKYSFDAVIHFAALKSPSESVQIPLEYYENNLVSTLNILRVMRDKGIKNFVFSSSATVYGDPDKVPIDEDSTLNAVNPYGRTKLMIEDMLKDISVADEDMNIAILRYFNPVGAHPSGEIGEKPSGIPKNLFPYISQVAAGILKELPITGDDYPTKDGTGIRDYVHVEDIAEGHIAALKRFDIKKGLYICNLGTGNGYSVKEVVAAYEAECKKKIPVKIMPRRPGDVAECYADVSLAKKELGWSSKLTLTDMCRDSWNWQKNNLNGYE